MFEGITNEGGGCTETLLFTLFYTSLLQHQQVENQTQEPAQLSYSLLLYSSDKRTRREDSCDQSFFGDNIKTQFRVKSKKHIAAFKVIDTSTA